jgi:hypothetical protein
LHIVTQLRRTVSGKVQKFAIRKELIDPQSDGGSA